MLYILYYFFLLGLELIIIRKGSDDMNPPNKKYETLEELREAQRRASREYYQRNREKVKARMKRNYEAKKKKAEGDK